MSWTLLSSGIATSKDGRRKQGRDGVLHIAFPELLGFSSQFCCMLGKFRHLIGQAWGTSVVGPRVEPYGADHQSNRHRSQGFLALWATPATAGSERGQGKQYSDDNASHEWMFLGKSQTANYAYWNHVYLCLFSMM
ncbi:TPA: hypothetical protein ACKPIN_003601 [Pseudomonas aeruginosa]